MLARSGSYFLIDLTSLSSVPLHDTMTIGFASCSTSVTTVWVVRFLSMFWTLLRILISRPSGYPDLSKAARSSFSLWAKRSWLLIILLSRRHCEYTIPEKVCRGWALLKFKYERTSADSQVCSVLLTHLSLLRINFFLFGFYPHHPLTQSR